MELDLQELGQRIRRAREDKGYSQEAFAIMIGKDQTAISEYENGKRRMFITDLPLLAEKLDVPITYFFTGQFSLNDMDQLLLDEFHRLPNDARPYLVQMIQTFAIMFDEIT